MIIGKRPVNRRIDRPSAYKIEICIQLIIPRGKRKHPPAIINCHKNKEQNKNCRHFIKFLSITTLSHATNPYYHDIRLSLPKDPPSACSRPMYIHQRRYLPCDILPSIPASPHSQWHPPPHPDQNCSAAS